MVPKVLSCDPPELLAIARPTDADDVWDARERRCAEWLPDRAFHVAKELIGEDETGDGKLHRAVQRERLEEVLSERQDVRGANILRERLCVAVHDHPEVQARARHTGEEVALADPRIEPEVRVARDDRNPGCAEFGGSAPLEDTGDHLVHRYPECDELLDDAEDLAPGPTPVNDDADGVSSRHRCHDRTHLFAEQRSTGSRDLTESLERVEVSQASHLDHVVGRWSEVAVERDGDDWPPADRRGRSARGRERSSERTGTNQERIGEPSLDDRIERVGDRARPDARQRAPTDRAEPTADEHINILREEERLRYRAKERATPQHSNRLRRMRELRHRHFANE